MITPDRTPPIVVKVASTTDWPVYRTAFAMPSGRVPSSRTRSVIWIELSMPMPMIMVPTMAVKMFRLVPPVWTVAGYQSTTIRIGRKVMKPKRNERKIRIIVTSTSTRLSTIVLYCVS